MKEALVTRTVKSNEVTYLAMNLDTHEVTTEHEICPASIKEKDKMLKYLINLYNNKRSAGENPAKPVEIIEVIQTEQLYGMTERTFIENATKMTSRKRNNNTENTETDNN